MSSAPPADPTATGAKKKNKKKNKNANKPKEPTPQGNGQADKVEDDNSDGEGAIAEYATSPTKAIEEAPNANGSLASNGHKTSREPLSSEAEPAPEATTGGQEALHAEVERLKEQLEQAQAAHGQELEQLRSEVEEATGAKEQAEEQYQNLLERVEKLKSTLSDRLKRDKEELEEAKERVDELEAANEELRTSLTAREEEVGQLKDNLQDVSRESASLRSRSNLSSQNWLKEKEELTNTVAHLKEEIAMTTNAMGEWEVIAMEERSIKESLSEKVTELEGQMNSVDEAYRNAIADRDAQAQAMDSLQRALQDLQDTRKRELREMVEREEALEKSVQTADEKVQKAEEEREKFAKELERTLPFEKEVKEKNLLIGKLRHEAIVLNDHLTKALRYLKKTKPEDNVDRQIVTNHLLHFLTLDRSDPKRFQILQVMASYLNWTDEQREQAGISRPGGSSSSSYKLPLSPFQRTPSTPSLNTEYMDTPTPSSAKEKESLAELWAGFLERSALEEAAVGGGVRKDSSSSVATGGTAK